MNTQFFKSEQKKFCVYCGKEIVDNGEWDDGYYYEEYKCDCLNAKTEIEYQNNIERNKSNINYLKRLPQNQIERIKIQEEIRARQEMLEKYYKS